jgi:hypothetical protein
MARPNKQGVDYFSLDVHLDDKFKFIEIKYGLEGFAIVIKLLQRVYSQGYWCRWTEDELLLFSDEIKADTEVIQNVVNESLKRDIFDGSMFEKYSILTSRGIQKRYKEIVRRRKDVEVTEEYLLIDDMVTTSSKHDDGKSTQTERKQKGNRKETKKKNDYTHEFEEFWKVYPRKIEKKQAAKAFGSALKRHSFENIVEGTKQYAETLKRSGTEERFIKHASTFLNNDSFLEYGGREEEKENKEQDKIDAIYQRRNELQGALELSDGYYRMMGEEIDREATQRELNEIEQWIRDHQSKFETDRGRRTGT